MKKILSVALCVLMLFACVNVSAQNISVELDANKLEFDVPPTNIDGRVLVPVRTILEAMGATVLWNGDTKTVTSKLNSTTVIITIDSCEMRVNGEKKVIDVPAKIIDGRTLVPARAVTESFGANVLWDAHNTSVKIFTKDFLLRAEEMKIHKSSKTLSEEKSVKSDFSISYFEEMDVRINANDGTDFEIVSTSDNHSAILSVRADIYTGPEHPMTESYAKEVANGMVTAISGTLTSTEISHIDDEEFIKIHYTVANYSQTIPDDTSDVLVYMGIKSGVVYTMTYTNSGCVPKNVHADINYIMNTLIIH